MKKSFKDYINEASLSRVWQHSNDKDTAYAIITAFRGENSLSKNESLNRKLANDIRSAGFGYVLLDGFWLENEGTPEEQKVKETSFFITASKENSGNLKGFIRKAVKKYSQEAAVFRPSGETEQPAILINNDHSEDKLGKIKFSKAGSIYSRLKNKPQSTFVFETARTPKQNWISALAEKKRNET